MSPKKRSFLQSFFDSFKLEFDIVDELFSLQKPDNKKPNDLENLRQIYIKEIKRLNKLISAFERLITMFKTRVDLLQDDLARLND